MESDDPIDHLTGSLSDGTAVDWDNVEVGAELDSDTVEAMRVVARIAGFHRSDQRRAGGSSPASPVPGSPGPRLEKWRELTLLEPIGAGARGEVWRAWDSTLQRQVALKFLQPSGTGDGTESADLLNEARSLARVRHTNIVTVFGIAEDQGRTGMWMECVPGVTLAHEIERAGALPARHVVQIGIQLCSALEALSAAGLIHRDVKPANVLLESLDRAVLTDFGLGWRPALEEAVTPRSSGTPLFMAPEVLAGEKPTHQSDLYALGVTLWWALAGQSPFEARTVSDLKSEVARGPSRSLHSIRPDAPRSLIEAILWAMKPSRSERARSAADLAARLRAIPIERRDLAAQPPQALAIAVLPFVNRTPESDDEYFSDGLADELIGMLAKIRGLRVAARASAFTFRGRQASIDEIGRALNVDAVLEGRIHRSGDRIRISVQLVNVSDGLHLWSDSYDRALDDVLAVQDDIAQSVVRELRAALLGHEDGPDASREVSAEIARASKGRAKSPVAHRLWLLGRHFINRLNREDLARAIQNLKEAVSMDPEFAIGWTELGAAYTRAATYGVVPKVEAIRLARDSVHRALTIEPDLAEAHARMAAIQMFHDWDWASAEVSYSRALELAPGDAMVLNGAGVLAMVLGRTEESIELHRRAAEQDPLSASPYHNLGLTLRRGGRFAEAEAALRRALEVAPQRYLSRAVLGRVLADQGREEEGLVEAMREADDGHRRYVLAIIQHKLGNKAEGDAALRELMDVHGNDYAAQIAEAHAIRGDADASFEWLDRAYRQRDFGLSELRGNSSFRALHVDHRWRAMMIKMGFEPGSHGEPG